MAQTAACAKGAHSEGTVSESLISMQTGEGLNGPMWVLNDDTSGHEPALPKMAWAQPMLWGPPFPEDPTGGRYGCCWPQVRLAPEAEEGGEGVQPPASDTACQRPMQTNRALSQFQELDGGFGPNQHNPNRTVILIAVQSYDTNVTTEPEVSLWPVSQFAIWMKD